MRSRGAERKQGLAGAAPSWVGLAIVAAAVAANLGLVIAVAVGRFG